MSKTPIEIVFVEEFLGQKQPDLINVSAHELEQLCHFLEKRTGAWTLADGSDATEEANINVSGQLMIITACLARALVGGVNGENDEDLPHREVLEVGMADAIIGLYDLAGALKLDLVETVWEKLEYNLMQSTPTGRKN